MTMVPKKIIGLFFLIFTFGLLLYSLRVSLATSSSPDAIAIRVLPNPKHFSAARWYREQKFTGSPQSLIVDGFEAIRDGRTVYVNAANIYENSLNVTSGNMLGDVGFEDGMDGVNAYSSTLTRINTDKHSGTYSVEVKRNGADLVGFEKNLPPQTVGTPYTISFWAKSISGSTNASVSFQDGSGETSCLDFNFTLTNNWQKFTHSCASLDVSRTRLYIWTHTSPPNTTWLADDIELYKTPSSVYEGKLTKEDILYSNVYVISYNNDAEKQTEDIFGQILAHWKFTTNLTAPGKCNLTPTATSTCFDSSECQTVDYCKSSKSIATRDVKRLADLADLNTILDNYKNTHSGLCPKLSSGTYLPNTTVSTWPSWQGALGQLLGGSLPLDPVNQLGQCIPGSEIKKPADEYTSVTGGGCLASNPNHSITSCNGMVTWTYPINVTDDGYYKAFIESTNSNVSARYGDIYKAFGIVHNINVYLDGNLVGQVSNPASSQNGPHSKGYVDLGLISSGAHTLKYEWVNDWVYDPDNIWGSGDEADSNILIYNVGLSYYGDYNPITCWSENKKLFADPTPNNGQLDLPVNSLAYSYVNSVDGKTCAFDVAFESGLVCDSVGACKVGLNIADPVKVSPIAPISSDNRPPVIIGANLPLGSNNNAYAGYVSAYDPDNDPISLTLTTVGNWSSWPQLPTVTKTAAKNQYKIFSASTGATGTYEFTITVTDSKASSTMQNFSIKVSKSCEDADGDGYGVCPNCGKIRGCKFDGNDCDDTSGLHIVNGRLGDVKVDGKDINPGEPDDCSQFDGIDHNCNGRTNENAQVSTILNAPVQNFENMVFQSDGIYNSLDYHTFNGVQLAYPQHYWSSNGWYAISEPYSDVKISSAQDHTSGAGSSLLFHQDADIPWSGCSQRLCESPKNIYQSYCTWDNIARTCSYKTGDQCHANPFTLNEGQQSCWGVTINPTMFGYTQYALDASALNPNDTYLLNFYYKGTANFNDAFQPILGYPSPGWPELGYKQTDYVNNGCLGATNAGYTGTDGYVYNDNADIYDPTGATTSPECENFFYPAGSFVPYGGGNLSNGKDPHNCWCLILAKSGAEQRSLYYSSRQKLVNGNYNNWTFFPSSFKYDKRFQGMKDTLGKPALSFYIDMGYNDTGPTGSDLYVDDLKLMKCKNCSNCAGKCGDGNVDVGETCDYGAKNTSVPCTAAYGSTCVYCDNYCQKQTVNGPKCGDGVLNGSEQCDDATNNTDIACTAPYGSGSCVYCDKSCQKHTVEGSKCGDGIINGGEQCDDAAGNTNIACTPIYGKVCNYCDPACQKHTVTGAKCGDGNVDIGEQCDLGALNSDTGSCDTSCYWVYKKMAISWQSGVGSAVAYDSNDQTNSSVDVVGGTYLKALGVMPTPYIWIAQSTANRIAKIRAYGDGGDNMESKKRVCIRDVSGSVTCKYDMGVNETRGQYIGDFPVGNNPSRTAVNVETGDVWVGARNGGTITSGIYAGAYAGLVTKLSNDGTVIKTCPAPDGTRGVAIAENGDVWVGGLNSTEIWRINGNDNPDDCKIATITQGYGTYGLAIDGDDNIWSADAGHTVITKMDTKTLTVVSKHSAQVWPQLGVYGITIDPYGNAWGGAWTSGGFYKVDKTAPVNSAAQHFFSPYQILGVSTDIYGNIWGGGYTANVVQEVDQAGNFLYTSAPAAFADAHGVCGDSSGQVWAIYYAGQSQVYDAASHSLLVPSVYNYDPDSYFANTYTYSDMTGINRAMVQRTGDWDRVIDAGLSGQHWGSIRYTASVPSDKQYIKVSARSNDSLVNLESQAWLSDVNWNASFRIGRYLEIKVVVHSNEFGVTPVVWGLKIQ